ANAPLKGRIQKRKTNNLQIITSGLQRTAGPYRCANALRSPLTTSGKKLHFQPEEVNASIPASAHSTSCSSVAPATPSAPSTWPARMIGRPPGRLISGAPSPMTVAARKYSEPSIDSSPLGRPDLAEANAFPIDARLASASAPSIRWRATRRPSASQTVTLMLTARLCALARAAWMARFASASLIHMSCPQLQDSLWRAPASFHTATFLLYCPFDYHI